MNAESSILYGKIAGGNDFVSGAGVLIQLLQSLNQQVNKRRSLRALQKEPSKKSSIAR